MTFEMNFTDKGKETFKKLARDEGLINYNNLFFKTGLPSIENFDFFKRYVTLNDLLIDLLNVKISIEVALLDQNKMVSEIYYLLTLLKNENKKVKIGKAKKKELLQ